MSGKKLWEEVLGEEGGGRSLPVVGVSRRSFLEVLGYSAAAVALSSCRAPEQKVVPYAKQPVELTPGVAAWYASTCGGCTASCGVLVKVRDGRPIKLEGNPEHPLTRGGLCPVAHAMVFGLYDPDRLRAPLIKGREATWEQVDGEVTRRLEVIKKSGGAVRVLTGTLTSPTSRGVIEKFLGQFKDARHVSYDAVSSSAVREAHARTHGRPVVPAYRLDRAKLVVSFGADFLGTWLSPVQFTRDYAGARTLQDGARMMLRHVQFESRMSLTGSNADRRVALSPADEPAALLLLARLVAERAGLSAEAAQLSKAGAGRADFRLAAEVERVAGELLKHKGESLVIAATNDPDAQALVNFVNHALGNYGRTLDLASPSLQRQGDERALVELVRELNEGRVAALFVSGVNPAYDYTAAGEFKNGLARVPLTVSLNGTLDETSALTEFVCPRHHFLEAWDDAEPVAGTYSLAQPSVAPLFQTRASQESFLRWAGDRSGFYEVLRDSWRQRLFPRQSRHKTFDDFWDAALHDGVFVPDVQESSTAAPEFNAAALDAPRGLEAGAAGRLALVLYEKVSLRDGAHANNPWLHELPDPLTKVTWDNYACVSPRLAAARGLAEGDVVRVSKGAASVELPVLVQPGQHEEVVAVALGYGRTRAGRGGSGVGANAFGFVEFVEGGFSYAASGISVEKTGRRAELAKTQVKDSLEGRPLFKEFTLAEYVEGEERHEKGHGGAHHEAPLYDPHQYPDHKWGMAIDLSACTGCSACVLSCQAENNIPVVGKDEVRRRREMHWLRVDRYYEAEGDGVRVAYQPLTCAQCDNASCESVCPVLATVHSSEGLNMQVYNRCVGTRYCANNCALKVRRFNWFEYRQSESLADLALNPDVTVRTRGVMEKCSFCVQRIEEVKVRARNEGREIRDGEIQPACQQSCPAGAIIFGDLVELKSRVNQLKKSGRNYVLLPELNLKPAVSYLAKVRNSGEGEEA
jgi:molybdopterin-containing oxidoreductase family iron-sulfur binding subunit